MKNNFKIVRLNSEYCDYLRKYDNRVPYNFNSKELRPFIGVLFYIDDYMYFAPLSSPKPKHIKLKNKIDFLKIDDGNLGAVNFNNMLPVFENNIIDIDLDKNADTILERKYLKLLKEQLYWLNRNYNKIYIKSKRLYDMYVKELLPESVINRCCNFKLLEEKCKEYNNILIKNK